MLGQYKFEDVFTSSDNYASRFAGPVGSWLMSVQDEAIIEVLYPEVKEGTKMLDLGGAHGQLIEIASRLNLELVIAASHVDAFKNLTQRMQRSGITEPEYEGVTSDLLDLPYKKRSFTIVTCVRLLSHCEDWPALIAEMCRVSSDLIIVDYPPLASSNIFYKLLFPIKKMLEGNTRTFTIFSHQQVQQVFSENGFELQQRVGQFFWPMVLHRKLKSVAISKLLENIARWLGLVKFFGNPTIAVFRRDKSKVFNILNAG